MLARESRSLHRALQPVLLAPRASVPTINYESRRYKSQQQKKAAPVASGRFKRKGAKRVDAWKTGGPIFRPLSKSQLSSAIQASSSQLGSLQEFTPEQISRDMVGRPARFVLRENDPVKMFGLPRRMLLEFRLLTQPCSVVRDITVDIIEMLENAGTQSSLNSRHILTGRAGCGKSYTMLQAVEHCIASDWLVMYIPRAVNLVNSTTTYEYDLRTRTYLQPAFAVQILQRFLSVNSPALSNLTTQNNLSYDKRDVLVGTTLSDLINIGLREQTSAPIILDALMHELGSQTHRPVLFAVDDFQAIYCRTAYRDPRFMPIRPYHLSIPRLIMEYASGKRSFARGAFLGALTASDTQYNIPIELQEALDIQGYHATTPYDKRSKTLEGFTKGLRSLPVPERLSVPEAASLYEIWMKDKAVVPSAHDEVFMAKYTESSGNARDFVWRGLLSTLESS